MPCSVLAKRRLKPSLLCVNTPGWAKGYNFVVLDANGEGAVLECACPLVQVRRPQNGEDAVFCANTYKLPAPAECRPAHPSRQRILGAPLRLFAA